jgi:DNA-binding response OmpR family regulator
LAENGFAVTVCHGGDEAHRRATTEDFSALVLDVMLPGCSGIEIVRRLRAANHRTPVVLLTALGDVNHRIEGLNAGADDYMWKPFSTLELVARLRALLRRPYDLKSHLLTHGDLTVDLISREARRGSRPLALTPREFSLLEFLLSCPDQVVTRTEIGRRVWGYQLDPDANVIDMAVQRLRRKIDLGASASLIQTVRGVGYSLARAA